MLKFQTSFSWQSLYLYFAFTAKNYRNLKKCNGRIVKLFRKKLLGRRVCLSLVTQSLKRTHLASLSRSCSQSEMLQMFIHLMQFTWWFWPGYLSARVTFFKSLTLVEMSGMLILIKGNDILALNNVTRILPVRLKVKLKKLKLVIECQTIGNSPLW